ncbi:hypothetical protein OG762_51630 (plasmid) [Streptomyces sp. NBC_01136]|uniref:RapZ C-terminal domain-containing protein n=1 Tax=Streptomyces sp. NBC_01136 TaxID=2903754 RepID=UPI002F9111D9|nr:hypothetical protein OG762_51630 [Streptomyces sp. NBC_01136]
MTTDTALASFHRLAELQSRGDEILSKSIRRTAYDDLRTAYEIAVEAERKAAIERDLAEYGDKVPPKVTPEELLDYRREKRAILREIVGQFGEEEFGASLADAEAQFAEALHQAPPAITYTSVGLLHGPAPEAEFFYDMRPFKDPHLDPNLRELTAEHELVMRAVFNTPGVPELGLAIRAAVDAHRANPLAGPVRVVVACAGGRHRSAAMVRWLAMQHHGDEIKVATADRDIHRPVVGR